MSFFKQYVLPFFVILVFLVALVAVSARIFLPSDMVAPAPVAAIELQEPQSVTDISATAKSATAKSVADLPLSLKVLIQGLPATSLSAPL
jgi:hypothetical protein